MDKKQNTCCFFGHREVTHNIRPKLTALIEKLITEENVTIYARGTVGYIFLRRVPYVQSFV